MLAEPPPRLLHSIREARDLLGVSERTFFRLLSRGDLEAVRIGARTLVVHDVLVAYVQNLRAAHAQRKPPID